MTDRAPTRDTADEDGPEPGAYERAADDGAVEPTDESETGPATSTAPVAVATD